MKLSSAVALAPTFSHNSSSPAQVVRIGCLRMHSGASHMVLLDSYYLYIWAHIAFCYNYLVRVYTRDLVSQHRDTVSSSSMIRKPIWPSTALPEVVMPCHGSMLHRTLLTVARPAAGIALYAKSLRVSVVMLLPKFTT